MSSNGKGSARRPAAIKRAMWDLNYEQTFQKKEKRAARQREKIARKTGQSIPPRYAGYNWIEDEGCWK
jgi:hypothetical protein